MHQQFEKGYTMKKKTPPPPKVSIDLLCGRVDITRTVRLKHNNRSLLKKRKRKKIGSMERKQSTGKRLNQGSNAGLMYMRSSQSNILPKRPFSNQRESAPPLPRTKRRGISTNSYPEVTGGPLKKKLHKGKKKFTYKRRALGGPSLSYKG